MPTLKMPNLMHSIHTFEISCGLSEDTQTVTFAEGGTKTVTFKIAN